MRLKIISDGRSHNTRVINAQTGEELEGITSIEWGALPGELNQCTITLHSIPIEAEVLAMYELTNENRSS